MWVLKLGGSLYASPHLPRWLEVIARYGAGRVVIVPGGGPFADGVRAAQQKWRFSDAAAHRMALLAMEQYAWMLIGMQPGLIAARTVAEIRNISSNKNIPVWLPSVMVAGNTAIAETWDVTSDSLAAWLATQLGATQLLLVKPELPAQSLSPEQLSTRGIVDQAFAQFVKGSTCEILLLPAAQHGVLEKMLQTEERLATRVAI
ncbi:MAG: aspartate kinase [Burkholderiales bacterium]